MRETREAGLLLVGHGTLEPEGQRDFLCVAREVRRQAGDLPVEPCFLEFTHPTIEEGVARLVDRGKSQVVVAPLLLFAAGHVRRDIPAAVASAVAGRPVEVVQAPPLGNSAHVVGLSRRRFAEALAGRRAVSAEETLLILVGRGSGDHRSQEDLHALAALRRADTPARIKCCFLATGRPTLGEALAWAAAGGFRRVVVQPHLLFAGSLLRQVASEVGSRRARTDATEWIVAPPLGPDPALAEAVLLSFWGYCSTFESAPRSES